MTRQLAADDYEAIRKRMEELRPQPQPDAVPRVDDFMADLPPYIPGQRLSLEEALKVAKAFNCRWGGADTKGCGRNFSRECLRQGKCL